MGYQRRVGKEQVTIPDRVVDFGRAEESGGLSYRVRRAFNPVGEAAPSRSFATAGEYRHFGRLVSRMGFRDMRWDDVYEVRRACSVYLARYPLPVVVNGMERLPSDPVRTYLRQVTKGEFSVDDSAPADVESLGLTRSRFARTTVTHSGHLVVEILGDNLNMPGELASRAGLPGIHPFFQLQPLPNGRGFALPVLNMYTERHFDEDSRHRPILRYYLYRTEEAVPKTDVLQAGLRAVLGDAIFAREFNLIQELRLSTVIGTDHGPMPEPAGYWERYYAAYHQHLVMEGLVTPTVLRAAEHPTWLLDKGLYFAPMAGGRDQVQTIGVSYEEGVTPQAMLNAAAAATGRFSIDDIDVLAQKPPHPPSTGLLVFSATLSAR